MRNLFPHENKLKLELGNVCFIFASFYSNDHLSQMLPDFWRIHIWLAQYSVSFRPTQKQKLQSSYSNCGLTESSCSSFWWLLWCGTDVQTHKRQSKKPPANSSAGKLLILAVASFHSCNTKRRCLQCWVLALCLRQQLEWHHFHLQWSLHGHLHPPVREHTVIRSHFWTLGNSA